MSDDLNRGPSDMEPQPIRTGGPPLGPPDDKAPAQALAELERRQAQARREIANATLVLNEVEKQLKEIRERLEGKK